jgi:hypothetical protein
MKKRAAKSKKATPKASARRIDRTRIVTISSFAEADRRDREYWWSRTPFERLRYLELLRQRHYGYGPGKPRPKFQYIVKVRKLRET